MTGSMSGRFSKAYCWKREIDAPAGLTMKAISSQSSETSTRDVISPQVRERITRAGMPPFPPCSLFIHPCTPW